MYTSHGVVDMHALAFSTQKNSDLTFLTKENMTKHFFTLGHFFFFFFWENPLKQYSVCNGPKP